jgi:hypothetical protein
LLHVGVYVLRILVTFIYVSNVYLVTLRDLGKDYFVTSCFKHLMLLRDRNLWKQLVLRASVRTRIFN